MFAKKVVIVNLLAAMLLLAGTAPVTADETNWVIKIDATDSSSGMKSSGGVRIGWRAGYSNSIDAAETGGIMAPPPGASLATGADWQDEFTMGTVDYRLPLASGNTLPQVWGISVWYQDSGEGPIDPIKVTITQSSNPAVQYPYSSASPLTVRWTPDGGQSYEEAVFTSESQLQELTFNINGKATYDYNNPDIIITAGEGGEGFAPEPQPPSSGGEESGPSAPDSPTVGTIAWAKTFADETTLTSSLENKVVSRSFPSLGYFYIQEADRSSGIRVNDTTTASYVIPGDLVSIPADTAQITSTDGERVINSDQTAMGGLAEPPKPLGVNNRDLGGGAANAYTPGPAGGVGLNNVGLLVEVWGKVTSVGSDYFYLDDGSNKTDGSGATGVRVVGVTGYMPAANDYVAVTGISGLATYGTDYARTVRLAEPQDFSAILPLFPPAGLMVLATGSGKITLYWEGVPGATGYNIYRGTTSGGENYSSPVNGGTPVNEKSYSEGNFYWFTDTGLTDGQEYFYTVKAAANGVESQPSDEGSDIPDASAIPWDTADAYAITSAAQSAAGYGVVDLVRVVGPDRRVYDNIEGTLPPDGEFIDDETIQLRNGTVVALSKDVDPDQDDLEPTPVNPTDGPIRRVRSNGGFNGVKGDFRAIDRSTLNKAHPKDHIYMYLGSHKKVGKTVYECDAGLQWSTLHGGAYNPYLSMNKKGPKERKYKVSGKWVLIDPSDKKQFGAPGASFLAYSRHPEPVEGCRLRSAAPFVLRHAHPSTSSGWLKMRRILL
ncbi:MAG: fibronectin type III domain-containing protein, partial [Armatimonadetes bacterium]|nr:fibronectin type III domain-containing protein [Armatimonadota bacterium]